MSETDHLVAAVAMEQMHVAQEEEKNRKEKEAADAMEQMHVQQEEEKNLKHKEEADAMEAMHVAAEEEKNRKDKEEADAREAEHQRKAKEMVSLSGLYLNTLIDLSSGSYACVAGASEYRV